MKGWYQRFSWVVLLLPLSWLFQAVARVRRWWLLNHQYAIDLPIVVVGNITVGGTGKTPLVIYLAKALTARGLKVAVISRGYKSSVKVLPHHIKDGDLAMQVGDEPLLISRHTRVPVVIDSNRVRAVKWIQANFACDVIISDDGLQHYRLKRDIEIVVIDGVRRFGNGLCLPAGPMREPISRLQSVDFKVANGKACAGEVAMSLRPKALHNLTDYIHSIDVSELVGKTVHAVAGIGYPERFFHTLEQLGASIIRHPFEDHHSFVAADLEFTDKHWVVMTEKDAVKCQTFAKSHWWALAVEAEPDPLLLKELLVKLMRLLPLHAKLSQK